MSPSDASADTAPALLLAKAGNPAVAFRSKRLGIYREQRWDAFARQVARFAQGLSAQGVGPGDTVALLSDLREDALVADLAVQALGATILVISRDEDGPAIQGVLAAGNATTAIVEDQEVFDRLVLETALPPGLVRIATLEEIHGAAPPGKALLQLALLPEPPADLTWLTDQTAKLTPGMPAAWLPAIDGTLQPVTHARQIEMGRALLSTMPALGKSEGRLVALLPGHDWLGRLGALILPLLSGLQPHFAERPSDLPATLAETRPGVVLTSAAWLDQVAQTVRKGVEAASPLKRTAYRMAVGGGLPGLGDRLVFNPILNRIGITSSASVLYRGILSDAAAAQWRAFGIAPTVYDDAIGTP